MRTKRPTLRVIALVLLCAAAPVQPARAYAVLAHEAIIDSAWDVLIKPLLLQRFPNSTPEDLRNAHAYAYGGAIVADMGYYPFGNKFFSDLIHYVRSGDFVEALIRDSRDLNEYAFALGAVAHHVADNDGHRLAVNRAVPVLYPKLHRKYGDVVTYDEGPHAHLKTEFGFDVLQVANGHYAPQAYHDHIGFQISQALLERAFQETYSLDLNDVFSNYDLAVGTFRRSVSTLIPTATKVAWQIKKDEIQKEIPGMTRQKFLYNLSRASYEKEWKSDYKAPGFGTKLLAFLISLIPKVGPFRTLAFRTPTPETEKMFMASFNATLKDYGETVHNEKASGAWDVKNDNLDTGSVTTPGEYPLADDTYAKLVDQLSKNQFAQTSPELRTVLLSYYGDPDAPFATKKNKKEWARVTKEIDELKNATSASLLRQ